ncbi:MAG: sulfite exporter TauE/SafE family protein, partial [Chloroflexota bacterium]
VIVGMNSALGALFHRVQGTLNWHVALLFGGSGMVVSYLAAGLSKHFSSSLLLVAFAVLMLVIGALLIFRKQWAEDTHGELTLSLWKIIGGGMLVGLLTGILGVGGGFLIVPALVMLVGLSFHQAVGTSLIVIAMNSAAGLLGHLSGSTFDVKLIVIFIFAGLAGTFAGSRLAKRLDTTRLRRAFAVFVVVLALFLLSDNFPKLLATL